MAMRSMTRRTTWPGTAQPPHQQPGLLPSLPSRRRHEQMLRAVGIGQAARRREVARVRPRIAVSICVKCARSHYMPRLTSPGTQTVVQEAYPESEFNVRASAGFDSAPIRCRAAAVPSAPAPPPCARSDSPRRSVGDMMGALADSGANAGLRKRLGRISKAEAVPLPAPLPAVVRGRVERTAAYKTTKEARTPRAAQCALARA